MAKQRALVIGGGLAGLSASMKLAELGVEVDLMSLVPVKRSHSVCAQGGINSVNEQTRPLGDSEWKPYREDSDAESECADLLNYWPEDEERPEGEGPLRYVAIRVRKRQGELFADGGEARYFCVASNQWQWSAKKLLEWHREKAGSIEALHDVLKNELAAGVMPCGRFGANAAWLRFAVMTHNALTALKRVALKDKWLRARPKRLRFHFFY